MSKKEKYDEYSTLYKEYLESDTEGAEGGGPTSSDEESEGKEALPILSQQKVPDQDALQLRSGNRYSRPTTPSPLPNVDSTLLPTPLTIPSMTGNGDPVPSGSKTNTSTNTSTSVPPSASTSTGTPVHGGTPAAAGPIQVIPSSASVREFTNADSDYKARDFMDLCENVMRNVGVTADVDKIAFISARVKPGSEASLQMRVGALIEPTRDGDYRTFRRNFLRVFGENAQSNLVKGVQLAAERVIPGVNALDIDSAQRDAYKVSDDFTRLLKDNNWGTADHLTWKNFKQIMEFYTYMLLLQNKFRSGVQELQYQPGEILLDFADRLKEKKVEAQGASALIAPVVEASNVTCGVAAFHSEPTHRTGTKPPAVCNFCKKSGHLESKCYARRREQRKSSKVGGTSGTYSSAPTSQPPSRDQKYSHHDSSQRIQSRSYASTARGHSPTSRGASGVTPYCHLHQTHTHSTDECYQLEKYRKDIQNIRRVGGSSSGEATRPKRHDPT